MANPNVNKIVVRAPSPGDDDKIIETICPFDNVTVKAVMFNDELAIVTYNVVIEKCEDTGELYPVLIADCQLGDVIQRVRFVSHRKLIVVEVSQGMYCQLIISYQPLLELTDDRSDVDYYCCFSKPVGYEEAKFGLVCNNEFTVISNGSIFIYMVGTNPICRSLTDVYATPSPSLENDTNKDNWVMMRSAPGCRLTETGIRKAFNKHFSNPV